MSPSRSGDTRDRILRAAEACFARRGYDGAGVAEICASAGVSKGAFYYHFSSKQALFLALLEEWLAGLDTELAAARTEAASVPEALARMAAAARVIFQAGEGRLPLFLAFWTQAAHDPAVWQATIEPYRRYGRLFAQWVEAGAQEGSFRPVDPALGARVLLALALGLILQGLLDPQAADWGQALPEGVRLLLDGLAQRGGLSTDC